MTLKYGLRRISLLDEYTLIVFLFALLAPFGDASQITFSVSNYNTLAPVQSAYAYMINASYATETYNCTTDVYGECIINTVNPGMFNITVSRSGYSTYQSQFNVTNDTLKNVYLTPSSHEGIIRLSVVDLTLGEHKSLIYFDNGRLEGVHELNETITLHTNMNYTWVPEIQKTDLLLNKKGLSNYAWNYLGIGVGILMFFTIIALFVGFLWKIMKH